MSEEWKNLRDLPKSGIVEIGSFNENNELLHVDIISIGKDIIDFDKFKKWRPLGDELRKYIMDNFINIKGSA